MKRLILSLLAALSLSTTFAADGDLFPYPKPTDDMVSLTDRCNFLVSEFWKRADLKGAMSRRAALNSTFGDWVSFMPYADADTVHAAIDRLVKASAKSGPMTLEFANLAEAWAHSDTTDIYSDEVFYPFAVAAANHKKVPADRREHFRRAARIIDNTTVGKPVAHLNFTTPDGKPADIDSIHTQMIIVMFSGHDKDYATIDRIRLSADINATALIRAGILTVVMLEPGPASDDWKAAAASYPAEWVVGAMPDAAEYFPMRLNPSIYMLDARKRLLAKDIRIDGLLAAMATLRQNTGL